MGQLLLESYELSTKKKIHEGIPVPVFIAASKLIDLSAVKINRIGKNPPFITILELNIFLSGGISRAKIKKQKQMSCPYNPFIISAITRETF